MRGGKSEHKQEQPDRGLIFWRFWYSKWGPKKDMEGSE